MFLRLNFLLSILILFILFGSQVIAAETLSNHLETPAATVLIYHRFGEDKYPSTNIDPKRFREQLEYLKTNRR